MSPSAFRGGRMSPSASGEGEMSPSAFEGGRMSPSALEGGRMSPSAFRGGRDVPIRFRGGRMSPSACGEGGCPIRFWHGALILCPTFHLFFMPPSLLLRLHAWAGQTVSELFLWVGVNFEDWNTPRFAGSCVISIAILSFSYVHADDYDLFN